MTRWLHALCVACVLAAVAAAASEYTVDVNAQKNRHPISELIYGINTYGVGLTTTQLLTAQVPLLRMGGNAMTRYNYVKDCYNSGGDWYFESGDCNAAKKDFSQANHYAQLAKDIGVPFLLGVPIIGWVQDKPNICSCYNATPACSTASDSQWRPKCGNCANSAIYATDECAPEKVFLPAESTHLKVDGKWNGEWAAYLSTKFGASAKGAAGTRIYELDNEPALWVQNHKDVHQYCVGYDELWTKMRDSALAILAADPQAEISSIPEWNYMNAVTSNCDGTPPPGQAKGFDKAAHDNLDLYPWLLKQFHDYEAATGTRLLHYVTLHHGTEEDNSVGVRRTRTFWDPAYVSTGWYKWIGVAKVIPRLREWVAQYYPGTKTAITEYYKFTGDAESSDELITQAMLLGIFGREALDLATLWDVPAYSQRMMAALLLYRNYDGKGSKFLNVSVQAASSDEDALPAYAAVDEEGTHLTLVLANPSTAAATVTVNLTGFAVQAGAAQLYAGPTAAGSSAIALLQSVALSAGQQAISLELPPKNVYLLALGGEAADPCAAVDCGAHGSCIVGKCLCRDSFSGDRCEIAPPASLCFATASDVGSNEWWLAFNVLVKDGHTVQTVAVVKDGVTTAVLSGPNDWGASTPAVYYGSASQGTPPPFAVQVTDTAGAVSNVAVDAFGGVYATCK